ncbi:MAG: hypothetical protein IJH65_05660 [Methanobrevibacter sp.]|nr:hypothetical protein [Methanobrevibacter sp.]
MIDIVNVKFIKSHQDEILELADIIPKCIIKYISYDKIEEYFEYNKENSDYFKKEFETIDEWINSQDLVLFSDYPEDLIDLLNEWVECYPQFERILNRQYFDEYIENDGVLNQSEELKRIEKRFHKLIMHRAGHLIEEYDVEMPHVTFDLEKCDWFHRQCFPVPGMYGGFYYYLYENETGEYELNVDSWSRICGGSGQTHIITQNKCELIDEGFV